MKSSLIRYAAAPAAIAALVLSLVAPLAASADDDAGAPANATTAGIGVARLSVADGNVAIQRGDSSTTVAAVVNAPILGADYVTTGDDSRAEVQYDANTMIRLGDNVQARFSHIDADNRSIQLAIGSIDVRLLHGTDGQTTIDTPSISIVPQSRGSYRVSVDADGNTQVTVRAGHANIVTPQGTNAIGTGTTLVASGPASNPQIQNTDAVAYDDFDTFNHDRDVLEQRAIAEAPYVNDNLGGVADLSQYGNWVNDSTYGQVWIPAGVAPGWAPYSTGNWAWEDSYGWTWVGAEPWGWAPYHYGRWYYSTAYRNWAWFPPRPGYVAPAWSPALVGFIGFNVGAVSVGIGFGNIGWVPLAPYEAFHPWWGPHGATIVNNVTYNNVYVHNVNVYNNTSPSYRNISVHNAVTSVSVQNFQAGRFNSAAPVPVAQLHGYGAVAVRGPLPVVPTAANLRYTERNTTLAVRQTAFVQRSFAGAPVATQRTPFAMQQASVARVTRAPMPESGPRAPVAAGVPRQENAATSYQRSASVPSYAHTSSDTAAYTHAADQTPAHAAVNDPWSRFNAGRNTSVAPHQPGYAHTDNAAVPATPNRLTQTGSRVPSSTEHTAPSYGTSASRPSYSEGSSYSRPSTSEGSSYSRPSTSEGSTYTRPSYSQGQGYNRPASPSYGSAPAAGRSYSAAPTYSRAAPANYGHSAPAPAAHESRSGGSDHQH
jgi:hypothetical protein